jgi:hypothetical protein
MKPLTCVELHPRVVFLLLPSRPSLWLELPEMLKLKTFSKIENPGRVFQQTLVFRNGFRNRHMKNFQLKLALVACLALLITLNSCKDDDEPAASKKPLLVGKDWIVVKYELSGVDITDDREECETDDITTFFEDGGFLVDVGDLKCDEFDTNVEGTWEFKANETILSLQEGSDDSDWDIESLTSDQLVISQYVDLFNGDIRVTMQPN